MKIEGSFSRAVSVEETARHLERVLDRIPVTRVVDLTPLDPLGLPVFSAVTPLALDLTTHAGKGADAASARVSALMEAVERISAERISTSTIRASYDELVRGKSAAWNGGRPVDPRGIVLPPDSRWSPAEVFSWVEGYDLLAEAPVWLPVDVVLNPPSEGILQQVDTNGLASGNTLLEAVVHGLCEVIERDIQSRLEFVHLFAEPGDPRPPVESVALGTLPGSSRTWVERLHAHGLELIVQNITGEIGVPSFRCLLLDPAYPTPSGLQVARFGGWGTAPNAEEAVLRALTEAVQSRLSLIQAARDSFNNPARLQRSTRNDRLGWMTPTRQVAFEQIPSFDSQDLADDLRFILKALRRSGFEHAWVAELTRPEWEIPVVRVRVPGLSSFYVNRRRVGQRCLRYLL